MAFFSLAFILTVLIAEVNSRACSDLNVKCPKWSKEGFCTSGRYSDYMSKNCKKSCDLCGVCKDDNTNCARWARRGYCTSSSFKDYMERTCPMSCKVCAPGTTTAPPPAPTTTQAPPTPPTTAKPPTTSAPVTPGPQGSILPGCSFDGNTCDWLDVPFDDTMNFQVTSGSTDLEGPSSGMGGKGGYAYVSSTLRQDSARLLLPTELILEHGATHGTACMTFGYYMAGAGTLYLKERLNTRRGEMKNLKVITGYKGNGWKTAQLNVKVSTDRQFIFEARPQLSTIAIDEVTFSDSGCA